MLRRTEYDGFAAGIFLDFDLGAALIASIGRVAYLERNYEAAHRNRPAILSAQIEGAERRQPRCVTNA